MKYALFVNTCDKFEDCWDPFFKLFAVYWPDFEGTIYLNTEYKEYTYENLNIVAVQGALKNNIPKTERATWSECLKWAMETIEEDVVLYLQEDYFFKDMSRQKMFIDDIASERFASNYGKVDIIQDVLTNRYDKKLLTYASCNYTNSDHCAKKTLEDIGFRYGPRIYDRFFEMFNVIEFKGLSLRE
jgi:hypothetical protein